MQLNNNRKEYINYSNCNVLIYNEAEQVRGFELHEVRLRGFKQVVSFAGLFHTVKEMDTELEKHNLFRVGGSPYYINPYKVTRYIVANAEEVGEGDYIFIFNDGLQIEVRLNFVYFDYFKNKYLNNFKYVKGM